MVNTIQYVVDAITEEILAVKFPVELCGYFMFEIANMYFTVWGVLNQIIVFYLPPHDLAIA